MWDKLRKQVTTELDQLHRLLESHRSLLDRSPETDPSAVELMALAAVLHSFYNGVENILKRIAIEVDGTAPSGSLWHRDLLDAVTKAGASRPAAISNELRHRLEEYLDFRHFFRHAYTFDLRWDRMRAMVLDCEPTFLRFTAEVQSFLQKGPGSSESVNRGKEGGS